MNQIMRTEGQRAAAYGVVAQWWSMLALACGVVGIVLSDVVGGAVGGAVGAVFWTAFALSLVASAIRAVQVIRAGRKYKATIGNP